MGRARSFEASVNANLKNFFLVQTLHTHTHTLNKKNKDHEHKLKTKQNKKNDVLSRKQFNVNSFS